MTFFSDILFGANALFDIALLRLNTKNHSGISIQFPAYSELLPVLKKITNTTKLTAIGRGLVDQLRDNTQPKMSQTLMNDIFCEEPHSNADFHELLDELLPANDEFPTSANILRLKFQTQATFENFGCIVAGRSLWDSGKSCLYLLIRKFQLETCLFVHFPLVWWETCAQF